jgi:hypothetical protein
MSSRRGVIRKRVRGQYCNHLLAHGCDRIIQYSHASYTNKHQIWKPSLQRRNTPIQNPTIHKTSPLSLHPSIEIPKDRNFLLPCLLSWLSSFLLLLANFLFLLLHLILVFLNPQSTPHPPSPASISHSRPFDLGQQHWHLVPATPPPLVHSPHPQQVQQHPQT